MLKLLCELLLFLVVATKQDPLPGWIDNVSGATGIIISSGMGLMRSIHCHGYCAADIVPVDMVISALVATAWQVHRYEVVWRQTTMFILHREWGEGWEREIVERGEEWGRAVEGEAREVGMEGRRCREGGRENHSLTILYCITQVLGETFPVLPPLHSHMPVSIHTHTHTLNKYFYLSWIFFKCL